MKISSVFKASLIIQEDYISQEREEIFKSNNVLIVHAKPTARTADSTEDQASDRKINRIVKKWLKRGLPPQNFLVATGDNGFVEIFKLLRAAGHTVIFATL